MIEVWGCGTSAESTMDEMDEPICSGEGWVGLESVSGWDTDPSP